MSYNISNAKRERFDYIPDKFVIGKFNERIEHPIDSESSYSSTLAIPSCRYKNSAWTQISRFVGLTGFKPNVQRDAEKELNKAVMNACEEIENVPTSGFKIVAFESNPYRYSGIAYKYKGDAVIYDPRGFTIQISTRHLEQMIEENDGDITNYELSKVKYVYIASNIGGMTLIPYESKQCKQILAAQNKSKDESGKTIYVKPSEFKVGCAYMTSDYFTTRYMKNPRGIYVYAGKHDTYSPQVIREALASRGYPDDMTEFRKNHSQWTVGGELCHQKGHVFVLAEVIGKQKNTISLDEMMLVVDSPSKMFAKEVPVNSKWTWLIDDRKPLNMDTITDFMESNPYFTKIDVERLYKDPTIITALSFKNFSRMLLALNYENFYNSKGDQKTYVRIYPFTYNGGDNRSMQVLSLGFNKTCNLDANTYYSGRDFPPIALLNDLTALKQATVNAHILLKDPNQENYSWRSSSTISAYDKKTMWSIYSSIKPLAVKIFLKNGRELSQKFFPLICKAWYEGEYAEDKALVKNGVFWENKDFCEELNDMWNEESKHD